MAPGDLYVKGIHERFGYFATWLPNVRIELGDVGVLRGKQFERITSLAAIGIPFRIRTGNHSIAFSHSSKAVVQVHSATAGELSVATVEPNARVSIDFRQEGAFLFQATGCTVAEIENKEQVGRAILVRARTGAWEDEWAVVVTLVRADCATIMVANSSDAHVELAASLSIKEDNLADPTIALSARVQRGDVTRVVAEEGLVPLFKISRVKHAFLSSLLKRPGRITFGGGRPIARKTTEEESNLWEELEPE